jgi:aminoglycoside phosphotransferase (APT) family kinase protein
MSEMTNLNMEQINEGIADRSDVFYWQTDRKVDPEQAGHIWADRHRYFTDHELIDDVNGVLGDDKLASVTPLDPDHQTNLGNVNSVRIGQLESGEEVIIRCHPRGIKNGYFYSEAIAAQKVVELGLPSYKTLAVHELNGGEDFAFQVIEKLPGTAIAKWLEQRSEDETTLITEAGKMMARVHQVKVSGFGPFDNEKAKHGELVGLHETLGDSVRAGLPFNLEVLQQYDVFTTEQAEAVAKLFESNPLLDSTESVLVHNDFADWNLLTDGKTVTGILDWDECVASDPISDIACWSTFFNPGRLQGFLDGYFSVAEKPDDFQDKFELLRLRYTVSKMTLRLRRYSWEPTDAIRDRIETGKLHLAESLKYFGL